MNGIGRLEVVYPFTKTIKIISWYQRNNPARQRFKNLLEPDNTTFFEEDSRDKDEPDLIETYAHNADFSGTSLNDIFAAITITLDKTLKSCPRAEERAFLYRYFTPGVGDYAEIAQLIGCTRQTASTHCKKVEDRLTRRFCQRRLLNPNRLQELLNFPDKYIN